MATAIKLGPLTRIEGHLDIDASVNGAGRVEEAQSKGTMFRGFEIILRGRDPRDAPHLTQRICGVCPTSHGMAAVMTLENASGTVPANNGRILRNLVLGADFLHSHILHFYQLTALDYVDTTGVLAKAPWMPHWTSADMIKDSATVQALVAHYVAALTARRQAHQMGAIFGGKMPCSPSFVPGGCSSEVTAAKISQFRAVLAEVRRFIDGSLLPDTELLGKRFPAYFNIGRGPGNLLAYGVFDLDATGTRKLLRRGLVRSGSAAGVDPAKITEYLGYSKYTAAAGGQNPSVGTTVPEPAKAGAYSWIKAPRYQNEVYEVGALARMYVNGDYTRGISVMDRLIARAREAKKIADAMDGWLNELRAGQATQTSKATPTAASGIGLTEAPRGAVGHWLRIVAGKIDRYQVVSPTSWNASPKDDNGCKGPIEQALIGTPVANPDQPVELLRVVHSFDPCLACSVHLLRADREAAVTCRVC